jgi:glutathione-regulated potassium-efflux system ancillary protein KefC
MSIFAQAAIVMVAAVVVVPLFKRIGLGAVLGYLFAGVLVGPGVGNVVSKVDEILHIAELGVVFFLFLVGLELQPSRLWALRHSVFGLGTIQVVGTTIVLTACGVVGGLSLPVALVAAMGLALSSTAIALRLLSERGASQGPAGQAGFAVLLFQDLAVVPLLAVIPLIAGKSAGGPVDIAVGALKIAAMVVVFLVGGRYLTRPLFKLLATTHVHEISTIVALLLVVGAGLAMTSVGMSMALGAFLAGVLLADSEYRHELEAAIEPFKGILLGLFFMAIGMSANLDVARASPWTVVFAIVVVVVAKIAVLMATLSRLSVPLIDRARVAAALSQGGEFAFVLYGVAAENGVLGAELKDILVVVVSLSMATTPLVVPLLERLARRLDPEPAVASRAFDTVDTEAPIIIAGFGRFGQIVGRALIAGGHRFTALEHDAEHVDFVRKFGNKLFYGDASHLDLLRAAGIERARALVIAVDNVETSVKIATIVKASFPGLPIYARVRNRQHAYKMLDLGVTLMERETYHSSLRLCERLLTDLDGDGDHAREVIKTFQAWDEALLAKGYLVHQDEAQMVQNAKQAMAELGQIFEAEAERRRHLAPSTAPESTARS